MAKAMGCNTISAYIFWNYHEPEEGVYDFTSDNHNISEFIKTVQDEDMWLILRPGPYVCAEWELGGIPPYLLRIPISGSVAWIRDIWLLLKDILPG